MEKRFPELITLILFTEVLNHLYFSHFTDLCRIISQLVVLMRQVGEKMSVLNQISFTAKVFYMEFENSLWKHQFKQSINVKCSITIIQQQWIPVMPADTCTQYCQAQQRAI